jgi:YfiH family protein
MWQWMIEDGVYVLRPTRVSDRVEVGFIGRSFTPGAGGPLAGSDRARLPQVHGTDVRWTDRPGELEPGDAIRTVLPDVVLTVRIADCAPLVLISPDHGIGIVHAGWRGVVRGILESALASFGSPDELDILIGPTLGVCCFEVGPDVAAQFPALAIQDRRPRPHLDLLKAITDRLVAAGASGSRIHGSGVCTRCQQHLTHSHRGSGGEPGRMLAYVVLRDPAADQSQSP